MPPKVEDNKDKWDPHHKATVGREPRSFLLSSLTKVKHRNEALDIGAGPLNTARFLLNSEKFSKVTAIDPYTKFEAFTDGLKDNLRNQSLVTQNVTAEDFTFPDNTYDFICAEFSLHHIPKERFLSTWQKIHSSLKDGGIFTGTLLGEKDGWKNIKENLNYHSKEEVEWLLEQYELIEPLSENEYDQIITNGTNKHWHEFTFIAKKKPSIATVK